MNKKERERAFLREVKRIDPEFPSGQVVDSESPDFIIDLTPKVLGIEIVEYVRGQNSGESALRRREVVGQKTINRAKDEFYKSSDVPLYIIFSWYPHRYPRQSEITELANVTVRAIQNNIPQNLFESILIPNSSFDGTPLEKFVRSIRITRVRNEGQILWSSIESGFIGAAASEIQAIISSKNEKVKQYKTKCDHTWLIIVADGWHISSTANLEEDALNYEYHSEFDRVIFYDHQEHKIKDLIISSSMQA